MGKRGRGSKRQSASGVTLRAQGTGPIKRTQQSPFDPAGSDEVEYVVDTIKAERLSGCIPQWLIGWKGYSDAADTWEPIDNLVGHEQAIKAFRERRKEEAEEESASFAAKKKKRKEEAEKSKQDDDGFEDAFGGKRRSACWKHFTIQKDPETGKITSVKCTLCPPENAPMPFSGNTTNLRSHLSSCHKDAFSQISAASGDVNEGSSAQGTIDELVPQVSAEKRDELHKLISLWLVRCRRPLTLPEHDAEFRDIFQCIFKDQYTPPTYKLVMQNVLAISAEAKLRVVWYLKELLNEGILPSIGGDIWSQGGISVFGILVYWLDKNFVYHERLLAAIPFSDVRHTGSELERATKVACASFGIGEYRRDAADDDDVVTVLEDTVSDFIHATCSDNASNIVNGWRCFDGHECCDHTIALIVKAYLDHPRVRKVFMKLRGMTMHFNHSVIGSKLLRQCQKRHDLPESKPPQDNDTRTGWGGACKQATWYCENQVAIQLYDVDNPTKAATAVPNPDGSVYKTHQLVGDEWDVVRESMYLLTFEFECLYDPNILYPASTRYTSSI
ncbi:La ribonucleoprotein [Cymbomonas tetramitiformis]|uniref:La ribonucleoprotein n=1 Tax=Cymbomonas tetramitiformis TaxID=36881 RepID=A0AAE0FWE6_9CHLO|nr:La ribonucleoprotein [Cymbomonas tetramitiformis]